MSTHDQTPSLELGIKDYLDTIKENLDTGRYTQNWAMAAITTYLCEALTYSQGLAAIAYCREHNIPLAPSFTFYIENALNMTLDDLRIGVQTRIYLHNRPTIANYPGAALHTSPLNLYYIEDALQEILPNGDFRFTYWTIPRSNIRRVEPLNHEIFCT